MVEFGVEEILKCDHSNATVYYSVHARWFWDFSV